MTLADLITQPVSYETAKELAIVLTPEQAATLGAIQAQYGNPRHVAAPVPLVPRTRRTQPAPESSRRHDRPMRCARIAAIVA